MPSTMTVVIFKDADGDEFPVPVYGPARESDAKRIGREKFDALVAAGDWRPTEPVQFDRVEAP